MYRLSAPDPDYRGICTEKFLRNSKLTVEGFVQKNFKKI